YADILYLRRISLPWRLEDASPLHRDDVIEAKADVRSGRLEHVGVAVRENRQLVSLRAKPFERRHHIGEGLEPFDLAHEPTHLIRRVGNRAAIHHVSNPALSNVSIGRVPAITQPLPHRLPQ